MKGQEQERVPAVQNIGSYIQGWKFLCGQNNRKRDNRYPWWKTSYHPIWFNRRLTSFNKEVDLYLPSGGLWLRAISLFSRKRNSHWIGRLPATPTSCYMIQMNSQRKRESHST